MFYKFFTAESKVAVKLFEYLTIKKVINNMSFDEYVRFWSNVASNFLYNQHFIFA